MLTIFCTTINVQRIYQWITNELTINQLPKNDHVMQCECNATKKMHIKPNSIEGILFIVQLIK